MKDLRREISKVSASIVISLVLIFSVVFSTCISVESVYAGTDTVSMSVIGNNGVNVVGHSQLTSRTISSWDETCRMTNSAGNYLYCVDPFLLFQNGGYYTTANILGHGRVTQDDLNYTAAGLAYIWNNYGANETNAYSYAQAFVWHAMNDKLTYSFSHFGLRGTYVPVIETILKNTYAYARQNKDDYVGYGTLYQKSQSQPVALFGGTYNPKGYVKLKKSTGGNNALVKLLPENYTLAGAEYAVYSDKELHSQVGTLITDSNGNTNTLTLRKGTYYVKEIKASKGYALDTKQYTVNVASKETSYIYSKEEPIFDTFSLRFIKKAESGADKNLSLAGAEYKVKYYKETVQDTSGLKPFRTWIMKTQPLTNDEKSDVGFEMMDKYKVGGDEFFKDNSGKPVGPIGTYTFEESKAPRGFAKTGGIISTQKVTFGQYNTENLIKILKDVIDTEKTQKININLQKRDAETGKTKAQGLGSFEGAEYDVFSYDPIYNIEKLVGKIVTDVLGRGSISGLKPGVYKIREIKAPLGYILDKITKIIKAGIKEVNTAEFDYAADSYERPITVEIEKSGLNETGVKENVKGATLQLFNSDNKLIREWKTDGRVETFKAIPVGKYRIHEKEAPVGYIKMAKDVFFDVKAVEETQKVEVFNEKIPKLSSYARFSTGVKESKKNDKVTIIDRVFYKDVVPGETYELESTLLPHKKGIDGGFKRRAAEAKLNTTGKSVAKENASIDNTEARESSGFSQENPEEQTSEKDKLQGKITFGIEDVGEQSKKQDLSYSKIKFVPDKVEGFVDIRHTVKSSDVKTETLYLDAYLSKEGKTLAVHAGKDEEKQKVRFPEIHTSFTEKNTGKHECEGRGIVTLSDRVSYKNLTKGNKYSMTATLMNKRTTKPALINGKELKVIKDFTAENENGFVDIDFTFDAGALKGEDIVAFESLKNQGVEVALHADINDAGQTVRIKNTPPIKTGDPTNIGIVLIVLLASLVGFTNVYMYRKRR